MRIKISPSKEEIYPNRGGYTGYSLCVWFVPDENRNNAILVNAWGGFWDDRVRGNGNYVIEARFFVYGSLLSHFEERIESNDECDLIVNKFVFSWRPIMDEILYREENLWKDKDRHGIHIDEVVLPDIIELLNLVKV